MKIKPTIYKTQHKKQKTDHHETPKQRMEYYALWKDNQFLERIHRVERTVICGTRETVAVVNTWNDFNFTTQQ